VQENAEDLNIRADKFMVAGHSAGGGLTAAVTLKARDTKDAKIAFQMPIYPMIDHRVAPDSTKNMKGSPIWDSTTDRLSWYHYLKGIGENDEVPFYAAPALNQDYREFPPTISFVAALEPIKDETTAYIDALKNAGIPTKFQTFAGAFHEFENSAPETAISKEANIFQLNAF
jgi:acetyl esterase/lipase